MRNVKSVNIFFALVLLLVVISLTVVGVTLGFPVAIKGIYALNGVILSFGIIYCIRNIKYQQTSGSDTREERLLKLLLILSGISITVTGFTGSTLAGFLILLPIGYGLTGWRAATGLSRQRLLLAAIILFFNTLIIRYLGTGFYFGNGDLNSHVLFIQRVLSTGEISVIGTPYNVIPGYHLLLGSASYITGIPPSDIPFIVGAISFSQILVMVYIMARVVFNNPRLGAYTVLALTFIPEISFYASYFYPQAFAVVLLLNLLILSILSKYRNKRTALGLVTVVLGATVMFTHHLSIILFAPVFGVIWGYSFAVNKIQPLQSYVEYTTKLNYIPYGLVILFGVFYWLYLRIFVGGLITQALFASQQYSSTDAGGSFYWFGVDEPVQTVSTAIGSLFSAEAISGTLFVAVFIIGIIHILKNKKEFSNAFGVLSIGVIGAIFIFPTPLSGKGFTRIGLPTNFFFALLLGCGLLILFSSARRNRIAKVTVIFIVVILGTVAPILGGGTIDMGTQGYSAQKELSPAENTQIGSLATFSNRYVTSAQTDWVTRGAMRRHGSVAKQFAMSSQGIYYKEGLLVYRSTWPNHILIVTGSTYKSRAVVSDKWLRETMRQQSKVYSTGVVRAGWKATPGALNSTR